MIKNHVNMVKSWSQFYLAGSHTHRAELVLSEKEK